MQISAHAHQLLLRWRAPLYLALLEQGGAVQGSISFAAESLTWARRWGAGHNLIQSTSAVQEVRVISDANQSSHPDLLTLTNTAAAREAARAKITPFRKLTLSLIWLTDCVKKRKLILVQSSLKNVHSLHFGQHLFGNTTGFSSFSQGLF